MTQQIPQTLLSQMLRNRKIRTAITRKSHFYFFHWYFAHYVKYATAPFHKELFDLTEASTPRNFFVVAFRGSGKSTIMSLSYPLFAILGVQSKKFVLLLSQTKGQAKQLMMNLRRELEDNALLRNDLGPFREETDEWGASSLVFAESGARITVASIEQSIRGLRHREHRPDLIICDDVEDLDSVKTRESRDKTYQWFAGEVMPIGDQNTRVVVVGNLLHEDSLMSRLKRDATEGKFNAEYREYPIVNDAGVITWLGKYPDMAAIEEEKRNVADEYAWYREYLLRIISNTERVIHPEWIQYYEELPELLNTEYRKTILSVDPAISEKDSADNTAMVGAQIHGHYEDVTIYILPNPVNERLTFPETFDRIKAEARAIGHGYPAHVIIEDVAYQQALIQQFKHSNFHVEGFRPIGDKRARLALTSKKIQGGKVLFPRKGAEGLIAQLVGFGTERHDDMADALAMLILVVIAENSAPEANIWWLS